MGLRLGSGPRFRVGTGSRVWIWNQFLVIESLVWRRGWVLNLEPGAGVRFCVSNPESGSDLRFGVGVGSQVGIEYWISIFMSRSTLGSRIRVGLESSLESYVKVRSRVSSLVS